MGGEPSGLFIPHWKFFGQHIRGKIKIHALLPLHIKGYFSMFWMWCWAIELSMESMYSQIFWKNVDCKICKSFSIGSSSQRFIFNSFPLRLMFLISPNPPPPHIISDHSLSSHMASPSWTHHLGSTYIIDFKTKSVGLTLIVHETLTIGSYQDLMVALYTSHLSGE